MTIPILALLLAAGSTTTPSPKIPDPCAARGDEVVVCGERKRSPYRMPKIPERFEPKPIRAEKLLAPGVNGSAHIDPVTLPGGARSNRMMVTIKIPF